MFAEPGGNLWLSSFERVSMKESSKRPPLADVNLLDCTPVRRYQWEELEGGKVIVLTPKFRHSLLVRYLVPLLKGKHFRVKLDEYGSFVWLACDGNSTVLQISERLKERYGDPVEPVYERVGRFIRGMKEKDLIDLRLPGG
ncbi:MAG: PqqD family protein [Ignavibacteriales bacterium CG07_land_8_20_14_0_80_59_12]|jgi:hypothetical protein|nr:MAG: PqqD family protein [Ignavibacteriales bacterium CG07_land_8_20_14_0_80_59_12]